MSAPLVIFGCGYIGTRLARAALADGRSVRVTGRKVGKLAPLAELGAEVVELEASRPQAFNKVLHGTRGATVVYAIPLVGDMPSGAAVDRATQAARDAGAGCFIYLGTSGLYGKRPEDDRVVDETSDLTLDDQPAFLHEETAVSRAGNAGLHTVILRVAPVYGVGRGVRNRMRNGSYQMVDDGEHWTSRIHVDDLVQIIFACEKRAPANAVYMVADDHPAPQREYPELLSKRLGLPMPPSLPLFGSDGKVQTMRARRLDNAKMKQELGITLKYPSYVEGDAQIEAEESAAT